MHQSLIVNHILSENFEVLYSLTSQKKTCSLFKPNSANADHLILEIKCIDCLYLLPSPENTPTSMTTACSDKKELLKSCQKLVDHISLDPFQTLSKSF